MECQWSAGGAEKRRFGLGLETKTGRALPARDQGATRSVDRGATEIFRLSRGVEPCGKSRVQRGGDFLEISRSGIEGGNGSASLRCGRTSHFHPSFWFPTVECLRSQRDSRQGTRGFQIGFLLAPVNVMQPPSSKWGIADSDGGFQHGVYVIRFEEPTIEPKIVGFSAGGAGMGAEIPRLRVCRYLPLFIPGADPIYVVDEHPECPPTWRGLATRLFPHF